MKTRFSALALLTTLMVSTAAFADDDCNVPMNQWQPREQVYTHVEQFGISVQRLSIDDGCYKVRGQDADGNRVKLQLDPATLGIMELEVKFSNPANTSRYLALTKGQPAAASR